MPKKKRDPKLKVPKLKWRLRKAKVKNRKNIGKYQGYKGK